MVDKNSTSENDANDSPSDAKPVESDATTLPTKRPVGYCSPPIEHQWPKKHSGNPKGRPKKPEWGWSPEQWTEDVLAAGDQLVTVVRNGKKEKRRAITVVVDRINSQAINGDRFAQKAATALYVEALKQRTRMFPDFYNRLRNAERNFLEDHEGWRREAHASFRAYDRRRSRGK